ncbi:MAG: hypothetical protein A2144_14515 [Chloroflexi bacterium RBG_16_50_9]|nr:MAG: hypothetical protein A2144_14515 [Chloroflexi bacterium RBG_16_50_9]
MAVRGVYTKAEEKMLADTKKDPLMQAGWSKAPIEMVAYEHSIKGMARAVDFWNPLWRDENYARNTRWGGIIAPPMFPERWGYAYLVLAATPEVGFPEMTYIGEDWEFFKLVHVNDSFRVWRKPPLLEDITSLDGKGPRRFKFMPHDLQFINQKDELVNTQKTYLEFVFPDGSSKDGTMPEGEGRTMPEGEGRTMPASLYKYTKEELAYIGRIETGEEIRGARIRYWEDVNIGEEPKPVVLGPTTFADMVAYFSGMGSNLPPTREIRKREPWKLIIDPVTGVSAFSVEHHFSDRAAQVEGTPFAFHFGAWARQLMARLVTNWMGDDGFLRRFNFRHMVITAVGDTVIGRGKVTNKRVENGEHLVDLSVWLENMRGNVTESAVATVSLLSREAPYQWK